MKGAKLKKQALILAGAGIDAYGLGATGLLVHKKTKNLAAKRLERALKDARGAGGVSCLLSSVGFHLLP